jgi:type I restriction enzyme, S subunit
VKGVPTNWPKVTLGDVITGFEAGRNLRASSLPASETEFGVLKISAVSWGKFQPQENKALLPGDRPMPRELVRKGDLLISRANTTELVGAPVLVDRDYDNLMLPDKILRVRYNERIVDPRYLLYALRTKEARTHIEEQATGTSDSMRNLSQPKLSAVPIPLAPLDEQRHIADKLDQLLAAVDTCKARLDAIPAILKRLRQSVLAAACSGQLTDEWRHGRPFSESAENFLQKLLTQREQVWIRSSAMEYRRPNEPDRTELPNHPDSWVIASMDELTTRITSGSRDWSKYYGSGTGTFLMAQNVRPGRLDLSFRQMVDPPANDRDRLRSQVNKGDLLVTIVGANTGDVCPVTDELADHYVCQSVALMRPIEADLCSFLNLWLNSSAHGRKQYQRYIYGEGRPHLSFDQLRMTPVAVPPPEEQQEIVRRVQSLLNQADRLEMKVSAARARVDESTKGLLAKAFCGDLVAKARSTKQQSNRFEVVANLDERL